MSHITYVNAFSLSTDTIQPTTDYTNVTEVVVNENFEAGNGFENSNGDAPCTSLLTLVWFLKEINLLILS